MPALSRRNPFQPRSRLLLLIMPLIVWQSKTQGHCLSDYIHEIWAVVCGCHRFFFFLWCFRLWLIRIFCGDLNILTGTFMSIYSNSTSIILIVVRQSAIYSLYLRYHVLLERRSLLHSLLITMATSTYSHIAKASGLLPPVFFLLCRNVCLHVCGWDGSWSL